MAHASSVGTSCKGKKAVPHYDSWCEVFGKDRADVTGAEDFHDPLNGILHAESQPKSHPDMHLDDNDMPYTPLGDEDAPPSVCEAGSSTTTKASKKTPLLGQSWLQYPDASKYKLWGEVNWEKLSEVFDDDLGDGCVDHPSNSSDLAVHETSEEAKIVPDHDYLEYLICMEFEYDLE
ncbi:hypothetical protein BUALT_Bualt02G0100500 [Buddleja alternifolia]|uniref:Uncharacterized protein n=1 Tax=Buddleja alternifolia TaxID=168488 RepID=A0AAV6Y9U2_9LAMI|nr:hypothetical protein BUALT_Bualt02G0100500 [Buddleja alternifolia]